MFALVDGNNFYASCEQVFQPELRGQPLVVLSNCDGCAIARSAQARALGITMGQPAHELSSLVRSHGLKMRSANFPLYGDMSARMVAILRDMAPRLEVYSIDESFLDLTVVPSPVDLAWALRERIMRWIGIPTCVGLGPTKTLAKVANKLAKAGAGVVDVTDLDVRAKALADFPVADLWGVGQRWAAKLALLGITTAAALRDAPPGMVRSQFGVVLARTQRELQGATCLILEDSLPDRKQIMVSRSFGKRVEDHQVVAQAVATFTDLACEKLRRRERVAASVWVFANTDSFRQDLPQHHPSGMQSFAVATSDTRVVQCVVSDLLRRLLRNGYAYKRAGVALLDLANPDELTSGLFARPMGNASALMSTLDKINQRFGRGSIGLAASSGCASPPQWAARQHHLSPRFSTRLDALPRARC